MDLDGWDGAPSRSPTAMANLEDPKPVAKSGWSLQGQHGPVGVFRAGRV